MEKCWLLASLHVHCSTIEKTQVNLKNLLSFSPFSPIFPSFSSLNMFVCAEFFRRERKAFEKLPKRNPAASCERKRKSFTATKNENKDKNKNERNLLIKRLCLYIKIYKFTNKTNNIFYLYFIL